MNKRVIIWLAGIILLGGAVIWGVLSNQPPETDPASSDTDAARFKEQYPLVGEDNRFVFASDEQVIDIFDSGSGLVFLGFQDCPWCQQLAPIADEAARAEGLDSIYYLDIRQARENDSQVYQKLVDNLREYLSSDEEGNPRIFVPDVTMVVDGEITGRFEQEPANEGEQVTPDTYWTNDRRSRAVEQLRQLIRG